VRLGFTPHSGVLKGERLRIWLALPDNETLKKTKQVFLLRKDQKTFPGRERVKFGKDDQGKLPGHSDWDVKPLLELFTLLKVSQDAEKKHVIWLAETKRGINYAPNEMPIEVHFYDANGTSVYNARLGFQPSGGLLKGERLRIWLDLPSNEILKKTTKVAIKKR
jgi:hypothetical protein